MGRSDAQRWGSRWDTPEHAFDEAFNREELRMEMVERRLERLEAAVVQLARTLARSAPQASGGARWGLRHSDIIIEGDYLIGRQPQEAHPSTPHRARARAGAKRRP